MTRVATPYGEAEAWAAGPARVYDVLAREIVQTGEFRAGDRVLDLGAGTGAASKALTQRGARPIALDLSADMLRVDRERRPPASAGNALDLPFRAEVFDAVVAAFVVSHVTDPRRALAESARVTRLGGTVLASTFSESTHESKEAVEQCAESFGYVRPSWYEELKETTEHLTSAREALDDVARAAGLIDVRVDERRVDVGLRTPREFVSYRMGMPNLAPFVASLDSDTRNALIAAACDAVGPRPSAFMPTVLILQGLVAR